MTDTTVRIQDDWTQLQASVVELIDDPTLDGIVVCNADGSAVG